LIPKHCSEVALINVSFSLSKENILKKSVGHILYYNTNYAVLTNGNERAVVKVYKSKNPGQFKKVESVEIVSLPDETGFVKDLTVNVNNPSLMAKIMEKQNKETVVVNGEFQHVSFVGKEKALPLTVYDFRPPDPPKLVQLVERALDAGRIEKPIKVDFDVFDLNKLAAESEKPFVMFPCYAEVSNSQKKVLYLVGNPNLSSIGIDNIVLIGCDLSLRIFKSTYRKTPAFINMCPLHRAEAVKKKGVKCIARCCKIGKGHLRIGDIAFVSYDPKLSDVEEAIIDLFELRDAKTPSYQLFPALRSVSEMVSILLRRISRT
jgi:hypothetical protein